MESPSNLSWTHYLQLIKIENEKERNFYEIEAVNNNWSVRELENQYGLRAVFGCASAFLNRNK
ncbi:MAG: DUF1016 N-terminal domain-containing protein [Bacteroidales bacterium]|nr:DUF1016 N-terminal domain-containing protein [Bacteroidales bacterium]